jgi:zinc transporter, ZIP family
MSLLVQVLLYGALCGISLLVGTVVSSRWWTPSAKSRSYIQHAAAGLVFAAVGVEVLPDMLERALPAAAAIGFALGVALVLGIEVVAEKLAEKNRESGKESQVGLIAVITTDIFIDGLLIGVAAVAGGEGGSQALLVTLALAAEMLSLGLSLGCTLVADGGFSKNRASVTGALLGIAPFAGAVLGFVAGTRMNAMWTEGILAFAAAALLYLAVEELLKDAHETKDTPVGNLLFFGSFLAILLIDMVS